MISALPGSTPDPDRKPAGETNGAGAGGRSYVLRPGGRTAAVAGAPSTPARPDPKVSLPGDGPLGKKEMGLICAAANAAFAYREEQGTLEPEFARTDICRSRRMEAWRRAEIAQHFSLTSLTEATQGQFNALRGHFDQMAPRQAGRAYRGYIRGDGDANKKRIALWKIKEACEAAGLPFPAYPLSIAHSQFKAPTLDDLSAKQAWALFYTMTNRRRQHEARPGSRPRPAARQPDPDNEPF